MADPTTAPKPPTTLVYLFSGDHDLDGEMKNAEAVRAAYEKQGGKVIIIGDGKHLLSDAEVKSGLTGVSGNYNLVIGTHGVEGTDGTLRMSFLKPGETQDQMANKQLEMMVALGVPRDTLINKPDDPLVDKVATANERTLSTATWASAGDIFKLLPPGVQSVMTTACHGGAVKGDTQFLPPGVPVMSIARSEIPALVSDLERGLKTFTADMGAHGKPIDMYLNYIVTGLDIGPAQSMLKAARGTTELPNLSETLPTEIAVAKNKSIDLMEPITGRKPVAISGASVDRITDMLMNDSHQGIYYGVTDDGKPIKNADGKIVPQEFTRDSVRAAVQKIADRLGRGDVSPDAPVMVYDGNDPATKGTRVLLQAQVAVGLVGAEVDARSTQKGIDLVHAFGEVTAPAVVPPAKSAALPGVSADVLALARGAATSELQTMNGGKPAQTTTVVVPATLNNAPAVAAAR